MNLYKKVAHLSRRERGLLIEVTLWLAVAKLMLLFLSFRRIAPLLGRQNLHASISADARDREEATKVKNMIARVGKHLPWSSKCFDKAIAGQFVLRRRYVASVLFLGVKRGGEKSLLAHAWLACGDLIVTGGEGSSEYTRITGFMSRKS